MSKGQKASSKNNHNLPKCWSQGTKYVSTCIDKHTTMTFNLKTEIIFKWIITDVIDVNMHCLLPNRQFVTKG